MKADEQVEGVSLIVPVFNEVGSVQHVLDCILNVLANLGQPAELIIVDDGSDDGSAEILRTYTNRAKIYFHGTNCGYGAALKTGIQAAKYSMVAITDADETYPFDDLPKLVNGMQNYDMVVGARTGSKVHIPLSRRPAKWLLNKLSNYLAETQIPDLNSGFRVFRRDLALNYQHILSNRFSFTTILTLVMIVDGYRVKWEPIDYYKRSGKSKIKPIDALAFLILIVRTITYFNPLRFFLPVALFLFIFGFGRLCYDVFWLHNLTDSTTLLFLFALQVGLIGILADLIVRRSGR